MDNVPPNCTQATNPLASIASRTVRELNLPRPHQTCSLLSDPARSTMIGSLQRGVFSPRRYPRHVDRRRAVMDGRSHGVLPSQEPPHRSAGHRSDADAGSLQEPQRWSWVRSLLMDGAARGAGGALWPCGGTTDGAVPRLRLRGCNGERGASSTITQCATRSEFISKALYMYRWVGSLRIMRSSVVQRVIPR